MTAAMSIRELKKALDESGADYSDCNEKHELVTRLEEVRAAAGQSEDPSRSAREAPAAPPSDNVDFEDSLAKMNNLLDTLPGALTLLDKKYSDARSQKVRGQLASIKEHLDQTAAAGATNPNWHAKLA